MSPISLSLLTLRLFKSRSDISATAIDLHADNENVWRSGANRVKRHVDDSEMRDEALNKATLFIALSQWKDLKGG